MTFLHKATGKKQAGSFGFETTSRIGAAIMQVSHPGINNVVCHRKHRLLQLPRVHVFSLVFFSVHPRIDLLPYNTVAYMGQSGTRKIQSVSYQERESICKLFFVPICADLLCQEARTQTFLWHRGKPGDPTSTAVQNKPVYSSRSSIVPVHHAQSS